jgi:hypothetical protein
MGFRNDFLSSLVSTKWKVIYVGNAEDDSGDQVLEEVMVGPVPTGINRFVLQADAPNPSLIANQDLIGVTVILITCSFMDHKFVQIGYYVYNEYSEPFEPENYPNPVNINKGFDNLEQFNGKKAVLSVYIWNKGSTALEAANFGISFWKK